MPNATSPRGDWHLLPLADVLRTLETREGGLDEETASKRLERHGPNVLPSKPPPAWWQIGLRQFHSPLIYILAVAAVVCVAIGDFTDAGFIFAVLAINALIGGYQEWRAERSSRALQKLLQIRATVVRDGESSELAAEQLVPGDVVLLESGNRVPADIRLMSAQGLEIDESLLTGESLAVHKETDWTGRESTSVADRRNMAYAGAIVVRGRGRGVVTETGGATVVGQLALDVMASAGGKPPLIERMERFSRMVAVIVLISAVAVAAIGVLVHGHGLMDMFFFTIALAVSAIPEGLPAALTVALAVATSRMARRGVIVRRLAAVEGLGSCTLIASDKTGTLTCNELTVRELRLPDGRKLEVTGEGFAPRGEVLLHGQRVSAESDESLLALARTAVLCNEGDLHQSDGEWVWRGDPTDLALLAMACKLGLDRDSIWRQFPQAGQVPFEPERQFAASFNREGERTIAHVKGAPERILGMCDFAGDTQTLQRLSELAESMAAAGYRVLGLASGEARTQDDGQVTEEQSGLRFLGFIGLIDPLRPGAREAVHACHEAGIGVVMITGDHPVTALAISRDLGLAETPDQVISGAELQGKSVDEMVPLLKRVRVFARVAPRQKLELVEAARRADHYVAVTGDGVNDAPALRAANIGVAMGRSGTDVAREAAELVITDDNFATIVAGVEEGRVAYDNVRKVIFLLISTGAAELVMVGLAMASGMPLPLLPVQLLWLNLVTNGIQGVALAFEPSEGDVLSRKPRRPTESIFNRLMNERTILSALVIGSVAFAAFKWMIDSGWELTTARNALLLLMVLFENIHIGNCRSETRSVIRTPIFSNPLLIGGVIAAQLLHIAMLYLPLGQRILQTEPVSFGKWLLLLGLAFTVLPVMELHKRWWAARTHRAASA